MPVSLARKICLWSIALEHVFVATLIALTAFNKAYVASGFGILGALAALAITMAVLRRSLSWLTVHAVFAFVFILALVYHGALLLGKLPLPPFFEKTLRPLLLGNEKNNILLIVTYGLTTAATSSAFIFAIASRQKKVEREDQPKQDVSSEVMAEGRATGRTAVPAPALQLRKNTRDIPPRKQSAQVASGTSPPEYGELGFAGRTTNGTDGGGNSLYNQSHMQPLHPAFASYPPRSGSMDPSRIPFTVGTRIPEMPSQEFSRQRTGLNAVDTGYTTPLALQASKPLEPAADVQYQPPPINPVESDYLEPAVQHARTTTVMPLAQPLPEGFKPGQRREPENNYVEPAVQQARTTTVMPLAQPLPASYIPENNYVEPALQQARTTTVMPLTQRSLPESFMPENDYVEPALQQARTTTVMPLAQRSLPESFMPENNYVEPALQQARTTTVMPLTQRLPENAYVEPALQQARTTSVMTQTQPGSFVPDNNYVEPAVQQARTTTVMPLRLPGTFKPGNNYVEPALQQARTTMVKPLTQPSPEDFTPESNYIEPAVQQQARTTTVMPLALPKPESLTAGQRREPANNYVEPAVQQQARTTTVMPLAQPLPEGLTAGQRREPANNYVDPAVQQQARTTTVMPLAQPLAEGYAAGKRLEPANNYVGPAIQQQARMTMVVPTAQLTQPFHDGFAGSQRREPENKYVEPAVHQARTTMVGMPVSQPFAENYAGMPRGQLGSLPVMARRDSRVSTVSSSVSRWNTEPQPAMPPFPAFARKLNSNGQPGGGAPPNRGPYDVAGSERGDVGTVQYERPPPLPSDRVAGARSASDAAADARLGPDERIMAVMQQRMRQYDSDTRDSFSARDQVTEDPFESDDGDQLSDDGASIRPTDSVSQVGAKSAVESDARRSYYPGYPGPSGYAYPPASQPPYAAQSSQQYAAQYNWTRQQQQLQQQQQRQQQQQQQIQQQQQRQQQQQQQQQQEQRQQLQQQQYRLQQQQQQMQQQQQYRLQQQQQQQQQHQRQLQQQQQQQQQQPSDQIYRAPSLSLPWPPPPPPDTTPPPSVFGQYH